MKGLPEQLFFGSRCAKISTKTTKNRNFEIPRANEYRKRYEEMLMKPDHWCKKNRRTVVGIHIPLREASS